MTTGRGERSAAWLVLTPFVPLVGLLPGGRWLWPLIAPLTLWGLFRRRVVEGRYRAAVGWSLLWAALLSAGVIALAEGWPAAAEAAIPNAASYRTEMFGWVTTGDAPENHPAEFIPIHLAHLGLFVALSAVSGGYLGLALGAWLVGYMSYFVGAFAAAAGLTWSGAVLAWVPWSVVRVVSFVAIGTILARPVLLKRPLPFGGRELYWLGAGCAGLVIDIALKTAIAPSYGLFLRSLLPGP